MQRIESAQYQEPTEPTGENKVLLVEGKRISLAEALDLFHQQYDPSLTERENIGKFVVLSRLSAEGFLQVTAQGELLFNKADRHEYVASVFRNVRYGKNTTPLSQAEIIKVLSQIEVTHPHSEDELAPDAPAQTHPLVALPKTRAELPTCADLPTEYTIREAIDRTDNKLANAKHTVTLANNEQVELQGLLAAQDLPTFGAQFRLELSDADNWELDLLLQNLCSTGFAEINNGKLVLHTEAIQTGRTQNKGKFLDIFTDKTKTELISLLQYVQAINKTELSATENQQNPELKNITSLPINSTELLDPNSRYYANFKEQILSPWEFGGATRWQDKIKLASGEVLSVAEIAICTKLVHTLESKRENGVLVIKNSEGIFVPFNLQTFAESSGINPSVTKHNLTTTLKGNGFSFIKEVAPFVIDSKLLSLEDFRRNGGENGSSEMLGVQEKKIPSGSGMVLLRSGIAANGLSARYYLGKDTIVGNPSIKSHTVSVVQLDSQKAALVQTHDDGTRTILQTLRLLSEPELNKKRESLSASLRAQGKTPTESDLTARMTVMSGEVAPRLEQYNLAQYLPKFPNESPEMYAGRIAGTPDAYEVATSLRTFLVAKCGVPIHQLSWPEQLILAQTIGKNAKDAKPKEKLQKFLTTYGQTGLQAFLTCEANPDLAEQILEIGTLLPEESARKIFERLSALRASIHEANNILTETDTTTITPEILVAISQNLTKKSEELLKRVTQYIRLSGTNTAGTIQPTPLDTAAVLAQLDAYETNTVLFTQTCKALRSAGKIENIEIFAHITPESVKGNEISPADAQAMWEIYAQNYRTYPESFVKELEKGFLAALRNPHTTFHIYRKDAEIVSFCRVDSVKDKLHLAAVNLNPKYLDGKIGDIMMDTVIAEAGANEKQLYLETIPASNAAKRYVELGFVATGVEFEQNSGVPLLHMDYIPKEQQANWSTKHLLQSSEAVKDFVRRSEGQPSQDIVTKMIPSAQLQKQLEVVEFFAPLTSGHALTQFHESKSEGLTYAVFQKLPSVRKPNQTERTLKKAA